MQRSALVFSPIILVLSALPAADAEALIATHEALVLAGDPAPGTGGGSFSTFGPPVQSETSSASLNEVVFRAEVQGSSAVLGVFVAASGEATRKIAAAGDPAPAGPGRSYSDFFSADIDSTGDVVFAAAVQPPLGVPLVAQADGVFRDGAGTQTAVALVGDPAPDTGGATYSSFAAPRLCRVCSDHAVVFLADYSSPNGMGIFRSADGGDSAVVLRGDPVPGLPGHLFLFIYGPETYYGEEVAFVADVLIPGGGSATGIFHYTAGGGALVALEGDPAPGGGTYGAFAPDTVVMFSRTLDFSDGARVYRASAGGAVGVITSAGDAAPGGGSYAGFPHRTACCAADNAVFVADVSGGSAARGIFRGDPVNAHEALVRVGDTAPDTAGGSYAEFPSGPSAHSWVDTAGLVSFAADVSGGSAASGVFQLPEPGGAASLLAGLCALALCGARRRRGAGLH